MAILVVRYRSYSTVSKRIGLAPIKIFHLKKILPPHFLLDRATRYDLHAFMGHIF